MLASASLSWLALLTPFLPALTTPAPAERFPERVYAITWATAGGTGPIPDGLGRGWLQDIGRSLAANFRATRLPPAPCAQLAVGAGHVLLDRDPTPRGPNPHAANLGYTLSVTARWTAREAMTAWLDEAGFGAGRADARTRLTPRGGRAARGVGARPRRAALVAAGVYGSVDGGPRTVDAQVCDRTSRLPEDHARVHVRGDDGVAGRRPIEALDDGEIAALIASTRRPAAPRDVVAAWGAATLARADLPWSPPTCADR
jgi:hypothetical protein